VRKKKKKEEGKTNYQKLLVAWLYTKRQMELVGRYCKYKVKQKKEWRVCRGRDDVMKIAQAMIRGVKEKKWF
jgi:hypothetical protein